MSETQAAYNLDSTKAAAVAQDFYWSPIGDDTPRGVKILLLGRGGVASLGHYHHKPGDTEFWTHWAPLPKKSDGTIRAADQPQQQAEPVAWMYSDDYERMTTSETFCTVFSVKVGSPDKGVTDIQLYTAPPPRKPLTDEMRKQMKEASDSMVMRGAFANGWLSAEAAHNIKEAV